MGKPWPQAPSSTGRMTTSDTYANTATLNANGTW